MTTTHHTRPRIGKRPHRGDVVDTRVRPAEVLEVRQYGLTLVVQTERHGIETISRHPLGHWTIYEAVR